LKVTLSNNQPINLFVNEKPDHITD